MPPASSADSTRVRILDAAKAEFARYGIAGARVDRIARSAQTSKERVYAYFRSKDTLYSHVAAQQLEAVADATQLDPTDLPGYAGRIHDFFTRHPENLRLMRWGQLERADRGTDDATRETMNRKVEQLRRAQLDGLLDPSWDPMDILMFLNQIAMSWAGRSGLTEENAAADQGAFSGARRTAIVTAVERLFPATSNPAEKQKLEQ